MKANAETGRKFKVKPVPVTARRRADQYAETRKVPRVRGLITAAPRVPSRVTAVRYKDGDVVRLARTVSLRLRLDTPRGILCSLIGDADGITWGELAMRSPWPEYETFLLVRRLERVAKAVVVERVG